MRRVLLAMMCLAIPSLAGASEMKLAWSECAGGGGPSYVEFACNTNSNATAHTLVVSFHPPSTIASCVGNDVTLDFAFGDAVTPDWWAVKGAGQCRNGTAIGSADFSGGPFGCVDPWAGQAVGGISSYNIAYSAPNYARMVLSFAVPTSLAQPLDENQEYYACKLTILNAKTVGTGSCAGCSSPAGILVSNIVLHQLPGDGYASLGGAVTISAVAGWQCPPSFGICDGPGCPGIIFLPSCATPTRPTTWGLIKAAYR